MDFRKLSTEELKTLRDSLRSHIDVRHPIYMGKDTSFLPTVPNYPNSSSSSRSPSTLDTLTEIADDEVINAIQSVPTHYAGMSSISGASINTEFKGTCSNSQTGSVYTGSNTSLDIRKSQSFGTSLGNTTSGGGDEIFSFQQSIAAGAAATLNLSTMTNLLQQSSVSIARIKGWQIRLLSGTDDTTISPVPTSTSTVTVTNIGCATPNALDFGNGGSALTLTLTAGAGPVTAVAIGASGSGYPKGTSFTVVPQQAGGSGALIAVTTDASGVPTSVSVIAQGVGYSSATVPSCVAGQYNILTGGAHCYFDPAANGFATVSATANNIRLLNMDGTNAITVEIDVMACTS